MSGYHRYLWSTRFVWERLRAGTLSEAASFGYFLAIMAFDWLQFTIIATTLQPHVSLWSAVNSWATFVMTVVGLIYLYVRNGGAKGERFLHRYFPLSVTVGWKFVVGCYAVMWLIGPTLAGASVEVRGWISTLVLTALNIAMFWRIGAQLASLARAETAV
ncbi:MAG: hypothetical protein U0236_10015 [Nitrospira sp.]